MEGRAAFPATPGRAIPEMLLAGVLGALLACVYDVLRATFVASGVEVRAGELFVGALDLIALALPFGAALGLVLGVLLALVRSAPFLARTRDFYGAPSRWARPDPERFAQPFAWLGTLGLVFLVVERAYADFATRFHRQDLAGYALAGLVVGLVVLSFVVYAALIAVLRSAAQLLGRFASFATFLALAVPAAIAVLVLLSRTTALEGVDPPWWIAAPVFVLAFLVAIAWTLARARRMPTRTLSALALGVAGLVWALYAIAAHSYGGNNHVRSVVEQRSLVGARLVRFYASRGDADHDGFNATFGGGDCDDHDATVHPGAPDRPGDGVDSDCFAGDGSPDVIPHGDGRFGTRPSPIPTPNFVIVTIDALRRDHLGTNGYARPTSPHIDAFAQTAVQLLDPIPSSSRSLRSIPGMWTGLYPSEIAWGPEYLWPALLPGNRTVAEILGAHGYRTAAVMATNYFQRMEGFFQGFDTVDQFEIYDPPRPRGVDEALPILETLSTSGQPFLLWVHLFNCHAPFLQDGVPSRYGDEEVDRYDTEIGFADAQFQRLLDAIDDRGIAERTVVVLASDHGEAFGEHGTFGHSTTLYEEEMLPMLFFRIPGVPAQRIEGNVSLIDLAPTLVELAGARMTTPISGESLLPILTGERALDRERPIVAELLPDGLHPYDVKMLRRGEDKLLWWSRDGRVQLFDLASDPGEQHDLSDDRPEETARMLGELRAWVAEAGLPDNVYETFVASHRLAHAPTPTTPLGVVYPTFELLGADLPRPRVRRGEALPLDLYYHVTSETDDDLFFGVIVEGPPGLGLPEHFHCWHFPLESRYPTPRWRAGEYLDDPCTLRIPTASEMPLTGPAHFRLSFQVQDGARLPIAGTSAGRTLTTVPLGEFDVDP
ncbi:MAG: sulfatase-like hydrolase/transferase [Sandaracinus sp.]